MGKLKHQIGALKDKYDERDYKIAKFLAPVEIPAMVDRSGDMLPVRDQGDEGTCVSFAACAAKESEETGLGKIYLAPRFLNDRIGQPGGGAYPRDAMITLYKIGVCPETCQMYLPNVNSKPCKNAVELAKPNKIKSYARLTTLSEMKRCLIQYGCFIIGVDITEKWDTPANGVIDAGGEIIGYHEIVFVGFNDNTRRVKIRNSWGKLWGDNGYGYIGYDTFMKTVCDAWSFVDVPEVEEQQPNPDPQPQPKPRPWPDSWFDNWVNWLNNLTGKNKKSDAS
jgi:hypothetical protein